MCKIFHRRMFYLQNISTNDSFINSRAILIRRQVRHTNATAKETKSASYTLYFVPVKQVQETSTVKKKNSDFKNVSEMSVSSVYKKSILRIFRWNSETTFFTSRLL